MGEAKQRRTATERLIAEHPGCALCGGQRQAVTRDHVPPLAMFDNSRRPDDLVVPACRECNDGSRTADLIVSIISRWRYSPTDIENVDNRRLAARLRTQAPEIIDEWTGKDAIARELAREHLTRQGVYIPEDFGLVSIGKHTISKLTLFSYKLTLALYFAKIGSVVPRTGAVTAYWRAKEDFQIGAIPKNLLELFDQQGTIAQGKWNERETFEYRYGCNKKDMLFGFVARCRAGLFFIGFAIDERTKLEALDSENWLCPPDILNILSDQRFEKRTQ